MLPLPLPLRLALVGMVTMGAACDGVATAPQMDAGADAGMNIAALCHDKCTAKLQVACATDTLQECLQMCVPANEGVCGGPGTALDLCLMQHPEPWFCFLSMVAIKQELCRPEQDALYQCQLANPRTPSPGKGG